MSFHRFGRVNYSAIELPPKEAKWYYSHHELQKELDALCRDHILKKAYGSLRGYLESLRQGNDFCDFSYLGGSVLLVFDHLAIQIFVHAMGMVQCRSIRLCELKIKDTKDFPPADMALKSDRYFYDLSAQFELSYEGQRVTDTVVERTDSYPFPLKGFDEQRAQKAEQAAELPSRIHFKLENGVDFGICADIVEHFYIELKK